MELKLLFTLHLATTVLASILHKELNPDAQQLDSSLKEAIEKITKTWSTHDVTIISHNNRPNNSVKKLANTISEIVSPLYPTSYFETTNLSSFKVNGHMAATSRTLLLFVYGAQVTPATTEIAQIVRYLFQVSHTKHTPRILLILIPDGRKTNLEPCLRELWKIGSRRVIGLEVPSIEFSNKNSPIIVHRYNEAVPSRYTLSTYNGDVSNWYTDQYQHLDGVELNLCQYNITSEVHKELLEVQLLVLKERLNASFTMVFPTGARARCDMTYNLFYLFHNRFYNTSRDHTAPIYMDRFCLFAPVMRGKVSGGMSWGLTIAFVVGVLIVGIVIGFSSLIDVSTFRRPFNVVAVILGVCLDSLRLSTGAEKVLYLCLVQVATRYTSMLYTEMFSEAAAGQREVRIHEFEDLYGLNLTIRVSRSMYKFFVDGGNSIVPSDLMPMFQVEQFTKDGDRIDDNVGHFSMQVLETFKQRMKKHSRTKRTNLCLGSVSVVHIVPTRWAYKDIVNDLLLRITQYGFRGHANSWNCKGARYRAGEQGVGDGVSPQRRMVAALLYGYLLVLLVFVGELVVWWIKMRRINSG